MPSDVLDSILRPDELVDSHRLILHIGEAGDELGVSGDREKKFRGTHGCDSFLFRKRVGRIRLACVSWDSTEPGPKMARYIWSGLNKLQLGKYAEYFVKMEFTMYGWEVYTSEVDDRGVDFVARQSSQFYEVQVKSIRGHNYVVFRKDTFSLCATLLAAVVLFSDGRPPKLYLIPATAWMQLDALFCSRDYEGRKSKPEWGLNISGRNQHLLDRYEFDHVMESISRSGRGDHSSKSLFSGLPHRKREKEDVTAWAGD